MENKKKLIDAFSLALGLETSQIVDDLAYNSITQWDSVAHMVLITELEACFDVMLDTDDIIDMNSVLKAQDILRNHGVVFE